MRWWQRIKERLADSPLAAMAGKAMVWTAAFGGLAWIGVGAAQRVTPAQAAAPPIPSATATATFAAAPSASSQAVPCRRNDEHAPDGVLADGRVVLNRAGVADLTKLPGIGEKRARAILALRDRLGRFRSLRDLLRVRGIGLAMLRRIEALVVIDPPADPAASATAEPRGGA